MAIEPFGDQLMKARKDKHLTQKELADRLGISQNTVSVYEKGKSLPDLGTAARMASVLDVNLDWLCGNENSLTEKKGITAAEWMAYLLKLLNDPPQYRDKTNMIDYLEYADGSFAVLFRGHIMTDFFNQIKAVNKLISSIETSTYNGLQQSVINRFALYFTPGYKEPIMPLINDFSDLFAELEDESQN